MSRAADRITAIGKDLSVYHLLDTGLFYCTPAGLSRPHGTAMVFVAPSRRSWLSGHCSWLQPAHRGTSTAVTPSSGRLLIHLAPDRVRVIDLADVYYLEAEGELTLVRTRSARRMASSPAIGPFRSSWAIRGGSASTLMRYLCVTYQLAAD